MVCTEKTHRTKVENLDFQGTNNINHTVDGRNPATDMENLLLYLYLQGFSIPGGVGFLPSTVHE